MILKHIQSFDKYNESMDTESEIIQYLNTKYRIEENLTIVGKNDKKKYNYIQVTNDISEKFGLQHNQSLDLVTKWQDNRFEEITKSRF